MAHLKFSLVGYRKSIYKMVQTDYDVIMRCAAEGGHLDIESLGKKTSVSNQDYYAYEIVKN
jgi:hypothetical protein